MPFAARDAYIFPKKFHANNGGDAKNKNKSRRLVLIKRGGATKGAALHIEHNNKY
jgi:hypothetical protein